MALRQITLWLLSKWVFSEFLFFSLTDVSDTSRTNILYTRFNYLQSIIANALCCSAFFRYWQDKHGFSLWIVPYVLQGWTNIFGLFQKLNQYMYFTLVKCFTPYVRSNKWVTLCAPDFFQELSEARRRRPLLWCFLNAQVHHFM